MNTKVGQKTSITLFNNGTRFPCVVVSDETVEPFTLRDGTVIEVSKVDVISLRSQRDDPEAKYLYLSNETVQFGYKPQMTPRFSNVIGLDVTEDGTLLTLEDIFEMRDATYSAFLADQAKKRNPVTDAADI